MKGKGQYAEDRELTCLFSIGAADMVEIVVGREAEVESSG